MNEKDCADIRMTDIIRRSGVSRSGVYKNYKSKEEIMIDIYRDPIKAIIDAGLEHRFLGVMNSRLEGVSTSFYIPLWNGMIYNAFMEWEQFCQIGFYFMFSSTSAVSPSRQIACFSISFGQYASP